MARKQKRLTRKQHNQERRVMVPRLSEAEDWIPPGERSPHRIELAGDMLPLMEMMEETSEEDRMMELLFYLKDSYDLADEPELIEILRLPIESAEISIAMSTEFGLTSKESGQLSEAEQSRKTTERVETATARLLDDGLRQEIIAGLEQLRRRLKETGQKTETAKAAALQLFLSDQNTRAMWPTLGLTQEIVRRSIEAGLLLMGATIEVEALLPPDPDRSPEERLELLQQFGIGQKISSLIGQMPGLDRFLAKQIEQSWEAGSTALFNAEFNLKLFSPDEIEAGLMHLQTLNSDTTDEADLQLGGPLSEANIMVFIGQIDAYLSERLLPQRLEQMQARLRAALQEGDYPPEHKAFIALAEDTLTDAEPPEYQKSFPLHAFIGELRTVAAARENQ